MLKNYFKSSLRNLIRNKSFTLINIPGMAIALASVILLLLFINHELSYDRFYPNAENIVRLITRYESKGKQVEMPKSIYELDLQATDRIPEVKSSAVVFRRYLRYIGYENDQYGKYQQSYVDEDFFEVFSPDVIQGDPAMMREPHTMVLTRHTAREIFGQQDPVNQTLEIRDQEFRVVAVIADVPANSHLQYDALLSIHSMSEDQLLSHGHDFNTYFLLNRPLNETMEEKICHVTQAIDQERYGQSSVEYIHDLQPLRRIHLHSDFSSDLAQTTDMEYIYIYSAIALFILLTAAFNFVNLSMARSETRSKEVGVRKVHGASPSALRKQFITESVILALAAFALAILLVEWFVSDFSRLVGSSLHLSFSQNQWWIPAGFILSLLVGLLAGSYPALYLSRMRSMLVLKGTLRPGKGKMGLQKILVSLQFLIAIALIASLIGILNQVHYLRDKDLGFRQDHVLVVNYLSKEIQQDYPTIRQELLENPEIQDVTASLAVPGTRGSGTNLRSARQSPEESFQVRANVIKPGFVDLYEIQMIRGRNFSSELKTDQQGYLISREAAGLLGMKDPVGRRIHIWGEEGPVLGVFSDIHSRSLHHRKDPMVLGHIGANNNLIYNISVKLAPGHTESAVQYVGDVFKSHDPGYVYQYEFVSDYLHRRYYRQEQKYARLMMAGTLMAMIISVMGLFALTAFHINRKIKEIGIRKVMGASSYRIIRMFSTRYLIWVGLSAFMALPLAYYFIRSWYSNFVYHSPMHWWFFAGSLFIVLIVALLTVLGKATMAANTNPAETLRDE
ncbi:MAG: ABC transporter permease [Bacteroidales bacterium]|nr:ABC transporter permease [Bacteroidales bacterium]